MAVTIVFEMIEKYFNKSFVIGSRYVLYLYKYLLPNTIIITVIRVVYSLSLVVFIHCTFNRYFAV